MNRRRRLLHIKALPPSLIRRNRRRIPQRRRNNIPATLFLHPFPAHLFRRDHRRDRHRSRTRRRRPTRIPQRRSQRQLDRTLPWSWALSDLSPVLARRPSSVHPPLHTILAEHRLWCTRHIHRPRLVRPIPVLTLALPVVLVLARHVRDDAHQALALSVLVDVGSVSVAELSSRVLLGLRLMGSGSLGL